MYSLGTIIGDRASMFSLWAAVVYTISLCCLEFGVLRATRRMLVRTVQPAVD